MKIRIVLAIAIASALASHASGGPKVRPWEATAPLAEIMQKVESAPEAPDSPKYLRSLISRAWNEPQLKARAFELLVKHHPKSPELVAVVSRMDRDLAKVEAPLRGLFTAPVSDPVLGAAHLALVRAMMNEDAPPGVPMKPEREAEIAKLLETVAAKRLAAPSQIEALRFELAHLMPGMPAPEIEGTDLDGKPMKLSEFRGKVVVVSFWGDW